MAVSKKKCKQCKIYHLSDSGVQVPTGWFCCFVHAIQYAQSKKDEYKARAALKAKKDSTLKAKAARKAVVELNNNDRSKQLKLTQAAFNKWIRFRDEGQACNSCGRSTGCKMNAGHFLSVGSHPELRFESLNVHLQCEYCNCHKSGNIGEYRPKLIDKIGLDKVEWLEGPHKPKKYTCEQLRGLRAYYAKLIKDGVKDDTDRPSKN